MTANLVQRCAVMQPMGGAGIAGVGVGIGGLGVAGTGAGKGAGKRESG